MKYLISCISFFLLMNHAFAQPEPIDTDRPDQTESPLTINKKTLQIEHGFDLETDNGANIWGTATLVRYGLLKNFELRVEGDFIYTPAMGSLPSSTELQPVVLATKISLWQEKKWLPKTSVLLHAGIPFLAARSFKNFNAQPGIKIAFQNNLSEMISWGYNVGAEWDGETNDPAYIYTFSNGIDFSKKVSGFLEIFGSFKKGELPQHNIDGGVSFLVNNNFKVDFSSAVGISKAAPDWAIAIGASVRFRAGRK